MTVQKYNTRKILFFLGCVTTVVFPYMIYAKTTTPVKAKVTAPVPASVAVPFQISAWIPYWRSAAGATDILPHLNLFSQISPFGYTVNADGSLSDPMHIDTAPWQTLISAAHAQKVKVIPTITWSDADAIDTILKNPITRNQHIQAIASLVASSSFDGVDIDYEGKKDTTENSFSIFLRDLHKAIGKKLLVCTIEPRTPLDSRFTVIPKDIQYANDFVALNAYCDQVRILTYDQGRIDLKLNKAGTGPYDPIADPAWIKKVVALAEKNISKKKIFIGVATYGQEFEVTPISGGYTYTALGSFDQNYALNIAQQFTVTPTRNRAGELSLIYTPTTTPVTIASTTTTALATSTSTPASFHLLWWSDAQAIQDKVALAKKLGIAGVTIFKIDGGEDPSMWNILK